MFLITFLTTIIFRYNLEKKLEKVEEDKKEVSEAQKEMIANLNKFREEKSKKDEILQKETS